MTYTQLCLGGVLFAIVLDLAILRTHLLRRRVFWLSYAVILFFQILTNGWLTGRQIVQYSGEATLGSGAVQFIGDGRLGFAPIEDIAFGFSLVLQTLSWWVFWGRRGVQRRRPNQNH